MVVLHKNITNQTKNTEPRLWLQLEHRLHLGPAEAPTAPPPEAPSTAAPKASLTPSKAPTNLPTLIPGPRTACDELCSSVFVYDFDVACCSESRRLFWD